MTCSVAEKELAVCKLNTSEINFIIMKHLKLIAALAMPAMFAACTSEDLYSESNNGPQQMEEVVGYKLLSEGASFQVAGAESRVSASTGRFHSTDLIGLGWVLNGNSTSEQFANRFPNSNRLYANHMFSWDEEAGFGTKGNIYEGWYFAYYPWAYEKKMGEKTFVVNPDQKSKSADDRVSQRLNISHLQFIDESNINPKNGELNLSYQVEKALNILNVRTTVAEGSAFEAKETEGLDDKAIRSITISTGDDAKQIFAGKLNLIATKLPAYNADLDNDEEKTVEEENKEVLLNALYDVTDSDPALVKADLSSSVTTYIGERKTVGEGEASVTTQDVVYKISESAKLYTILAPAKAALDKTKFNIIISLDNGYFEVKYIDPETLERELTDAETKNNAAIEKLVSAFAGEVEAPENEATTLTSLQKNAMGVDIVLYDAIFVTDFLHISNLTEWKDAVEMVTTLGRTEEEFAVDGVIEFNEGNIPMPNDCQITVNETDGASGEVGLKITKKNITKWPAGLTSKVNVINEKTVNNATGINGLMIENKGTLKGITGMIESEVVNNGGTITLTKTGELTNVNNEGGRINVLYGSKVTTKTGTNEGIIAYTIAGNETAFMLNNLMGKTDKQDQSANVNTFVVNSGRTLDLGLTDPNGAGQSDPYITIPGATGAKLASLADINIELNGGEIVGAEDNKDVNNVIMNGGIVNDVNIKGTLTAESGTVTSETITGNVVAKNTTITVKTITGDVVAENTTITAETITGIVTLKGESTINNAEITGDVTVETGTCNLNGVKISGELTIKAGASVVLNSQNTIAVGSIVSSGELTANNDIIVENNVTLNPTSTTTLTDGSDAPEIPYNKVIYHKGKYNDGNGVLKGRVTKYGDGTVEDGKATAFSQQGLTDALANPTVTEVKLSSGEYSMPTTNGDVKITGNVGTVITIDKPKANNVTLNGVTVQGSGNYTGIQHSKKVVYENCVVKGTQFLYAEEVELKNCTIDLTEKADYIWTYGAKNVKFDNCIFNTKGKAILIYSETNTLVTNVTVKNCTFNATESAQASGATAAAIEIDSSLSGNGHYTLTTENNTVDSDFSGEWRIKKSGKDNTTVNGVVYNAITIDGVAQ